MIGATDYNKIDFSELLQPFTEEEIEKAYNQFELIDDEIYYKLESSWNKDTEGNALVNSYRMNGENPHNLFYGETNCKITQYLDKGKELLEAYAKSVPTFKHGKIKKKKLKRKSVIYITLLQNRPIFKSYKTDVDVVIKFICSLINLLPNAKGYYKIPDRVIGRRCSLGRDNVYKVYCALSRLFPSIFQLNKFNLEPYIKIDKETLLKDEYIALEAKKLRKNDDSVWCEIAYKEGTIYFDSYCDRVARRKLRETIMGITLAYNQLAEQFIKTEQRLLDESIYGKRDGITYIEVPIHLISMYTGLPAKKLLAYINSWCRRVEYLKKHNETYIDPDSYYNPFHRACAKVKVTDKQYGDINLVEKPPVTPCSYILFNSFYEGTSLEKYVSKYYSNYEKITISLLRAYIKDKNDDNFNNKQFGQFGLPTVQLGDLETQTIIKEYRDRSNPHTNYSLYQEMNLKGLINDSNIDESDENLALEVMRREKRSAYDEESAILTDFIFGGKNEGVQVNTQNIPRFNSVSKNTMQRIPKSQARTILKYSFKNLEIVDPEDSNKRILKESELKLPSRLKQVLDYIIDCPQSEYKGQLKLVEAIKYYIKETIKKFKLNNNIEGLNILKTNLMKKNLYYEFNEEFSY